MKVKIGKYRSSSNKKRKIEIKIDPYDCWSLDHTLALIIHPALVAFRSRLDGISSSVYNEDVPEELQSITDCTIDGILDANHHNRWAWCLDEMIWAFERTILEDDDFAAFDLEIYEKNQKRKDNGRRLFAKYYESIWN